MEMQMDYGSFTMIIQRSLKKDLFLMEQNKGSGLHGLKMGDYLKVTMQTEKKMQLGLAGGIMIEQKKRCKEIIETDKWSINGSFMIKTEI